MDAAAWDERYAETELIWGVSANVWVRAELADEPPGTALDLACGEGRNALWLASRGWDVVAVDFSAVALDKGRRLEAHAPTASGSVQWVQSDVVTHQSSRPVDLALLCYLHLAEAPWEQTVAHAAAALAPGGLLLVIGHDRTNIADGVGGPQDPGVLRTAAEIADDARGAGLTVELAEVRRRPVDGAPRPALDSVVRARRPV